ncbi:type IV toxin-antitoxin system AbiEi family antitoxin domain-containing protein [Microbacterium paraoxydans]|uniref:type IV toxin-antitoxin system AbiEi family antitoxin domain-containing protein n=1 Tax=Microbacterium paraoxydans TaxID=199592 RepID=UPI00352DDE06
MFDSEFVTTREVAAAHGVSTREIARRVARGDLEPVGKLPGIRGAYLFNRAVCEEQADGDD